MGGWVGPTAEIKSFEEEKTYLSLPGFERYETVVMWLKCIYCIRIKQGSWAKE
jgi:hypothetical protein